ncbi:hypothetical protein MCC01953_08070 [Bifidobacteriaceae bacterium MCC01953]|nr:hypothetical protein MCC01953_08070 [Bifidobacteriaceae bacterium MCC01953]
MTSATRNKWAYSVALAGGAVSKADWGWLREYRNHPQYVSDGQPHQRGQRYSADHISEV